MKRYISALLALVMLLSLAPTAVLADSDMTGSENVKTLIKYYEGCVLRAYKAHPSETYWTIGYGHYGPDVYEGMTITAEQADKYFEQDIKAFERAVNGWNDKYSLGLNQNQFDALLSATYNFGTGWVEYYAQSGYRLAKYVQAGFKDVNGTRLPDLEIADAFGVLCNAGGEILPGLIVRRINEAEIFLYNDYHTDNTHFVYTVLDANGGSLTGGNRVQIFVKNAPYGTMPGVKRTNYTLNYWADTDTGSPIIASTIADKSRNLKAIWTSGSAPEPVRYTLTVNGGSGSGSYLAGESIRIVPDTKLGKTFTGWDVSGSEAVLGSDGYYYITMPAKNVTATALWKEGCPLGDKCPTQGFTDISYNHWAHNYVDSAVNAKLFVGTSNTTFEPETPMTRAMMVAVLHRLYGKLEGADTFDASAVENPYTDVGEGAYYYDAVMWAYEKHIALGFEDGTFRPNEKIPREQMVTMLHRYARMMGWADDESNWADFSSFSDASDVSVFARESMSWAIGCNIISGVGGNRLDPQGDATRAQVATLLVRFAGNTF